MTSVLPELQAVQPIAHVVLIMLLTHRRALVHRVRVCLGMDRQVALEDDADLPRHRLPQPGRMGRAVFDGGQKHCADHQP